MMQLLRKKTKAIMIVVAAAFIIGFIFLQLGVGTGTKQQQVMNIGSVNGIEITYNDFYEMQNNLITQLRQQGREDISEEEHERIEQQTWGELVFQILIQQEIERRNIEITDEEVSEQLVNNPPDFIRNSESFQTDGQFDHELYLQMLQAPENKQFANTLENWIRQTLPRVKLSNQIALGVTFSDDALLQHYRENMERVKVGYAFFDPVSLKKEMENTEEPLEEDELLPMEDDPYQPSMEEIRSYYDTHLDDFKDEERASLQYIEITSSPIKRDTTNAKDKAAALMERISVGEDFSNLARDFSEDRATADKGGDLGFLGRGEMLVPLEEVVFSMETGQVSEPILTSWGWHIVKLEDKREGDKGEEVRIRHILVPIKMGIATRDSVFGLVRGVLNDVRDQTGTFEEITASHNVPVKVTQPFTRNDYIPELGPVMNEAADFAFSQEDKAVSTSISRMGKIFVLRNNQRFPERTRTIEEVQSEIEHILSTEKKMVTAKEMADALLSEAKLKGSLKEAAAASGIEYRETQPFSRQDYVPGIGRSNTFIGHAHATSVGEISGPVNAENGYFVIEVLERKDIDAETFEKEKDQFRTELISRLRSNAFEQWYTSLLQEAEIVDNRLLFSYID
jgi:peptidyl-prolyl cis-trans isomerase D